MRCLHCADIHLGSDVVPEFRTVWSRTRLALGSLHPFSLLFVRLPLRIPPIIPVRIATANCGWKSDDGSLKSCTRPG